MPTRQSRSQPRPPVLADGTRERLLGNALRLFAGEGLKGVSLRRIVAESGAANPSALHYHVGNRDDLIEELADQVFARLRGTAIPRLEALAGKRHSVRDVLEAMFLPVLELRESGADGLSAVQFLARLSWEFGPEGQALSAKGLAPIAETALVMLEQQLPRKDSEHLRLQLLMAMTNVFHGLADYNYVRIAPFGPRKLLAREHQLLRVKLFFDYIEGGIRS
jgi:AcrR family transcriptional regulator